jgi:hypothetical protein
MATERASRSRTAFHRSDLSDASSPADSSSRLELAFHHDHLAVVGKVTELLERFGKDHYLEAARRIVQHEHAHAVALARLERPKARHDTTDGDVLGDVRRPVPIRPVSIRRCGAGRQPPTSRQSVVVRGVFLGSRSAVVLAP